MVRSHGPRRLAVLLAGSALAVVVAAAAPLAVVLGASRLVVAAVLATGAWVSVRRLGSVDLATAASALAGAAAGGIAPALAGVPAAAGILPAAAAGAALTAVVVAVGARVGRAASALTSLAVGIGAVAVGASWGAAGGRAGFHAVPLITGSDRGDLVVALAVLAGVLLALRRWSPGRTAAAAAVAVRAAHVAAALGHRPVATAARGGAVAGAVLGIGGWLQATATGSVTPGGYGLELSATLALAALVGGGAIVSGSVGALAVFGPAVLWPAAPVLGEAPVLVVGVLGLALLALRPGGLVPGRPAVHGAPGRWRSGPVAPEEPAALEVGPTRLPGGEVAFRVGPGELVAVVGPNGSGKSTLLARIGGQLPDDGVVRFGGRAAPTGAVARARAGLARTWQHAPDLAATDGLRVAVRGPEDGAAAATVARLLGRHADTPAGRDLVRLAARRPAIATLDEPGATLPATAVTRVMRTLAEDGVAVVVAEHRREIADLADRQVVIGAAGAPPGPDAATVPAVSGGGAPLVVEVAGERVAVAPGEVVLVDAPLAGRVVGAVLAASEPGPATVRIGGRQLADQGLAARVRRGLGVVTDVPPPADVSVRDHLAAVTGAGAADELLRAAPLLAGRGGDRTGVLSGGERRVLGWLVCLAAEPDAVVLDRAGAGLDPDAWAWATQVVSAWREAGIPVLVRPGRPEERRWAHPSG